MGELEKIDTHFWLTRSVARTVGINLTEAMAAGRLAPEEYSQMVARCRLAGCSGRCAEWLGAQTEGHASDTPPYCVHAAQLRALRPH